MDLEAAVLGALAAGADASFDTFAQAKALGVNHQQLVGAVKSLSVDGYVSVDQASTTWLCATAEGAAVAKDGSPEYRVYAAVRDADGLAVSALEAAVGKTAAKVGLGAAMREKWLSKAPGADGAPALAVAKPDVADATRRELEPFVGLAEPPATPASLPADREKQLMRRKLLKRETLKHFRVARGAATPRAVTDGGAFAPRRARSGADRGTAAGARDVDLPRPRARRRNSERSRVAPRRRTRRRASAKSPT